MKIYTVLHFELECGKGPVIIQHDLDGEVDNEEGDGLQLTDQEKEKIMASFLENYYENWLDFSIPALDGKTPREAVNINRTEKMKVINLIKDMSRSPLPNGQDCDFDKLFAKLGIEESELRKI